MQELWTLFLQGCRSHPIAGAVWGSCALSGVVLGQGPARIAGAGLMAYALFALTYHPAEQRTVFWHLFAADVLMLCLLMWLLARFNRRWLLWAVAIAALAVVSHLPRVFDPSVRNLGYATLEAVLGYILVVPLFVGTIMECLRHGRRALSG